MIGASRVMVVQTLKELQKIGMIGKSGKYYTLRTDSCINDIILINVKYLTDKPH